MTETQDWPGPKSSFAERLRWAREKRGYGSMREAATKLRWVYETYQKHEKGERGAAGVKDHFVNRYADGYKINRYWLQTGRGSPYKISIAELSDEEVRMIEAYRAART